MPPVPDSALDPVAYLIHRKSKATSDPLSDHWRPPSFLIEYEADLRHKSQAEVAALAVAERQVEAQEKADEESRRWYNAPECRADFDFWCKAAIWRDEEAVALSLGKDPYKVSLDRVMLEPKDAALSGEFAKRLVLMKRQRAAREFYDLNNPSKFLSWAKEIGLPYPPELDVVLLRGGSQTEWRKRFEVEAAAHTQTKQALEEARGKALPVKERESLLRMVIGMAMRAYNYDPAAAKNSAIGDIAEDLRFAGVALDEGTIRKFIQEAKILVSRDKTEQNP